MSIRAKTFLAVGLTLLGLLGLLYVTARGILLAGFARLEAQEVRGDVQRIVSALEDDVDALSATAIDYATWDDTYAFALAPDTAYIADNLTDQTYANLRLNVFVIIAEDGAVLYGGSYNALENRQEPMPAGLAAHLAPGARLLDHAGDGGSAAGLLLLPQGPLLVAAHPILPSSAEGPARGTLLLGRYLDAAEVARVSDMTSLSFLVDEAANPISAPDLAPALASLSAETPIAVRPLSAGEVAGYTLLPDLYGQPALILRVVQPRTLYQEGQATVVFFLAALLVGGAVFALINYLLLERNVLQRLAQLSRGVRQIGDRADASLRVTLSGQDELSAAANAINGMLAALARANQALRDSEQKFRTLAETSSAAIFIAQGDRMRYANSRAEVLTGYSGDDLLSLPFQAVVPALDHNGAPPEAAGAPLAQREIQLTGPRGGDRWLEVTAGHIDYEGQPATIATAYDITDRKHAQESLQRANTQLTTLVGQLEQHNRESALLSQLTDLLQACPTPEESYTVIARFFEALFPGQASALYLYRASRDYLGLVASAGVVPGEVPENMFGPDACWALRLGHTHALAAPGDGLQCRHVAVVPAGGYLCVPVTAQGGALGVLHLQLGAHASAAAPTDWQRLAETVSERLALALANVNLREALRHQAIRDPLTGLFNRRYMHETLEREISRALRSQHTVGVLFLDLDHFKHFNDAHGHDAGDSLLREFGVMLRTRLRAEDIVCRYGGEEFLLIMPEAALEATLERAEALRADVMALTVKHYGQVLGAVTVSVGVAMFPDHGATGELVIRAADQALYRAKQAGRDRVMVAES